MMIRSALTRWWRIGGAKNVLNTVRPAWVSQAGMGYTTPYRKITTGRRPHETTFSQEQQPPGPSGGYTVEEVVEPEEQIEAPPGSRLSWYVKRRIKGHTKKLSLLARQIRGLGVNEAIAQMRFSEKRRGAIVGQAIKRASQKADFYHDLSTDHLLVHNAYVGKDGPQPKRPNIHARARMGIERLRYSRLTVVLRDMTQEEKDALNRFKKEAPRIKKADLNPRGY
eukprot:gb/GECG01008336.1/.p1 GENE.gb/GECG01008336.1/~~gb/GECG01008336.1/.p1  ORF type:complete len:224 (+),score=15.82 gb/GECG01008336.1/:1-672(+)